MNRQLGPLACQSLPAAVALLALAGCTKHYWSGPAEPSRTSSERASPASLTRARAR